MVLTSVRPARAAALAVQHPLRVRLPAAYSTSWRCQASVSSMDEACKVLGVQRGATRRELRAMYIQRMRELHPDVNSAPTAEQEAMKLNSAYELLIASWEDGQSSGDDLADLLDVFDSCTEAPQQLFVNPFATNINPLMWQELQQVVQGSKDPFQALSQAGVAASESAVYYLTTPQKMALEEELQRMESSWAFDAAAFYLTNCLARARVVNNRYGVP